MCSATTVHNFTKQFQSRGHSYTMTPLDGGLRAKATGWGTGIKVGDFLLLYAPNNARGWSRYKVAAISYMSDPSDMWDAELEHLRCQNQAEFDELDRIAQSNLVSTIAVG